MSNLFFYLASRAENSGFWRALFSFLLNRMIPFNRSHGFKIVSIGAEVVRTAAPYRRSNHNHIRGIHACALATVAEFSAGLLLMQNFGPKKYRLIMSHMEIEYKYQAKTAVISECRLPAERIAKDVLQPLQRGPTVDIVLESRVIDRNENLVALARTTWQIKRWDKVKTRV
ncbi:YiiD C-terminal domain-containing protein [Desulfomarina sp.]